MSLFTATRAETRTLSNASSRPSVSFRELYTTVGPMSEGQCSTISMVYPPRHDGRPHVDVTCSDGFAHKRIQECIYLWRLTAIVRHDL